MEIKMKESYTKQEIMDTLEYLKRPSPYYTKAENIIRKNVINDLFHLVRLDRFQPIDQYILKLRSGSCNSDQLMFLPISMSINQLLKRPDACVIFHYHTGTLESSNSYKGSIYKSGKNLIVDVELSAWYTSKIHVVRKLSIKTITEKLYDTVEAMVIDNFSYGEESDKIRNRKK